LNQLYYSLNFIVIHTEQLILGNSCASCFC